MTDIVTLLKSLGAVYTDDHFVYTSGMHGEVYINKDALYPHPEAVSQVGKMFADMAADLDVDTVAAPALGGIILSTWTAYHLTQLKGKEVYGVYAEKMADKSMAFTRGYDALITGKKVLVIEDLTTTGGSVQKVVDLVRQTGGEVVKVLVMINRNPDAVSEQSIGAPFMALGEIRAQAWAEAELPGHIKARPINTKVGHGKKWLAEQGRTS